MTMRPSMVAAASISAALNRLGLTGGVEPAASDDERRLATWIGADPADLGRLVAAMEALMTAQLTSVQHQHQQQQQQQQQTVTSSVTSQSKNKVSTWEDVQPETPTDVQDVHF
jgi:Cyclin, C-terminal domain